MDEKEILKLVWSNEQALKENLLKKGEAEKIWNSLLDFLDKMPQTSIVYLRYRKLKSSKMWAWYSDRADYPESNTWQCKFQPFMNILEQYMAEKTIKNRLESEGLFIESRTQGEDQHILIGEKNGKGNKAHLIIDGKTAEIRVDDSDQQPEELAHKIETILTLPNGKKIRTTRELIEEL
jgi:hypothetical protein